MKCKKQGCEKAAYHPQVYCSRDCAPLGHYGSLQSKETIFKKKSIYDLEPNHMLEIQELLKEFYLDDMAKVYKWLTTPNPLLGGKNPNRVIQSGRGKKVLDFIKTAKSECGDTWFYVDSNSPPKNKMIR